MTASNSASTATSLIAANCDLVLWTWLKIADRFSLKKFFMVVKVRRGFQAWLRLVRLGRKVQLQFYLLN
jgi:hypothetical protein